IGASAVTSLGFGCSPEIAMRHQSVLDSLSDQFKDAVGWPSAWATITHGAKVGAVPWDVGLNMNDELYLGFEITLDEPEIPKVHPVLELLTQVSNLIERVSDQFLPFL